MRRASARLRTIRAWQRTCFPASSAARVVGRCSTGGVATTTASTSGDSIISRQSPTATGMSNRAAAPKAVSGVRDQACVTRTPGTFFSLGMFLSWATFPAPIMPTRTLSKTASLVWPLALPAHLLSIEGVADPVAGEWASTHVHPIQLRGSGCPTGSMSRHRGCDGARIRTAALFRGTARFGHIWFRCGAGSYLKTIGV